MVEQRGQRRIARPGNRRKVAPTKGALQGVQLAAGVKLSRASARHKLPVLLCDGAKVQLNAGAEAILSLCDGSRTRAQIILEASRQGNGVLAADIEAFLDAAHARGWVLDPAAP